MGLRRWMEEIAILARYRVHFVIEYEKGNIFHKSMFIIVLMKPEGVSNIQIHFNF